MEERYLTALDIGTTKIACLIAKVHKDKKIELVGVGTSQSSGVWCGQVVNIDHTVESIKKAVEEAQQQAGVKISRVNVGIAGKHIRCAHNRGYLNKDNNSNQITADDVEYLINEQQKVLVNAGEQIIHVLPQNYIVDKSYDVIDPVGMVGKMVEANFHLVIGKLDSIGHIKKSIERSNLITNRIILEPLASSDAVLSDEEKEAGVILIDIGGGTTDIAIYLNKMIRHTAVIPFGGNAITADIKAECGILERQAEELKKQFGEGVSSLVDKNKIVAVPGIKGRDPKEISIEFLSRIIQYRMEEILEAVMFEIQVSGVSEKIGAGIVLTGGGSMLKNLPQLVAFKTQMDVRIGYPDEYIESQTINKNINNPMYATAVGLLVKGLEVNKESKKKEQIVAEEPKVTPVPEPKPTHRATVKPNAFEIDESEDKPSKAEKKKEPKPDKNSGLVQTFINFFNVDEDTKHE